jgi:DtxR family Mn-dependent transcriptional regulator
MASTTVEDYIKRMFLEQQRNGGKIVAMGRLAEVVAVSPGTATSMVKVLAKSGLASYRPRTGCKLTKKGEELAVHVLRCHRLIELFLVNILGLDWSEIHEEAEALEHAVSARVLEKIDEFLGYPTVDPHGDPIPSASGEIVMPSMIPLSNCKSGQSIRVGRIIDQSRSFLRFAKRHSLKPGIDADVVDLDTLADAVTIQTADSEPVTLGLRVAAKILVETH